MTKKLIVLWCLVSGLICAQSAKNVDAGAFKKLIDEKKGVLIDLRTSEEITSKGKIRGSQQIDFLAKDIEIQIAGLDKKKTYLLYCAGGGRSGDCAEMMLKMGFKAVYNLENGFSEWKNKGYDIEK